MTFNRDLDFSHITQDVNISPSANQRIEPEEEIQSTQETVVNPYKKAEEEAVQFSKQIFDPLKIDETGTVNPKSIYEMRRKTINGQKVDDDRLLSMIEQANPSLAGDIAREKAKGYSAGAIVNKIGSMRSRK